MRAKILFCIGTRPEAIKLAPVLQECERRDTLDVRVCATAQHRTMLRQTLDVFGIRPDVDLDLMRPRQTLHGLTARALTGIEGVLRDEKPDCVVVQGDTTTAFAGALAAHYSGIPVAHVEAGLRTGQLRDPFPEEANRRLIASVTTLHFAPSEKARAALLRERAHAEDIFVVGNPVIDALHHILATPSAQRWPLEIQEPPDGEPLVLVTAHRREAFGKRLRELCSALRRVASSSRVRLIFPVHLNPEVEAPVRAILGETPNIHLVAPLEYPKLVAVLRRCAFVVTDSGGLQEEAPAVGKPVLVARSVTERSELLEEGTARLIGTSEDRVVREMRQLLDDPAELRSRSRVCYPYGRGDAAVRVADILAHRLASPPRENRS